MLSRSRLVLAAFLAFSSVAVAEAAPVVVTGCGDLAQPLARFRTLLGNPINGAAAGTLPVGRRDINWDGVPAAVTNNNAFPANFFNANSTRGLLLSTPGSGLRVSDNNFADVNATLGSELAAFTTAKTFAAVGSNIVDVTFKVSGSPVDAAVTSFGVVFSDVDTAGSTSLEFFNGATSLGRFDAPVRCGGAGHSFVGVVFTDGQRVTRVRITSGQAAPAAGVNDVSAGGTQDIVVMDDFLYGEPFAAGNVFTAILRGVNEVPVAGNGSGVATISIDPQTSAVTYSIQVLNVTSPTSAHIHSAPAGSNGGIVIDLAPTFNAAGIAVGTVNASPSVANQILANPQNFYVNVHSAQFPGGAVRGQLNANAGVGAGRTVVPIAGRVVGANNSFFRTDSRLVNLSGTAVDVLAEYYATGSATGAPTATATLTLAPAEQKVLNDAVKTLFNIENGTGAIVFTASRAITVATRIYNDQRASDRGTFGQFVPGFDDSMTMRSGALALLSNQPASVAGGSRTNLGWFNDSANAVTVTFRAYGPTGELLSTATQQIGAFVQQQVPLASLFPQLAPMDDVYVTFDATAPLVVYASVIDNTSGDAIFVPAHR